MENKYGRERCLKNVRYTYIFHLFISKKRENVCVPEDVDEFLRAGRVAARRSAERLPERRIDDVHAVHAALQLRSASACLSCTEHRSDGKSRKIEKEN